MCVGEVISTFIRDTLENRRKSGLTGNFEQKSLKKFLRAQFLEFSNVLRNKPHFILGKLGFSFFENFYDCFDRSFGSIA